MSAWVELDDGTVYVVHTSCTTEDGAIRNLLRRLEPFGCIELRSLGASYELPDFNGYTEL